MKSIACLFAIGLSLTFASAVQVYEPFKYNPGSLLAGQGGWALSSGTSPKITTNLTLITPGLQPATEGNSLIFGNQAMEVRRSMQNFAGPGEWAGPYWYSLAFKVLDVGSLTTNGGFIAAFGSTNPAVYGGRLYLRKDIGGNANSYNIGVSRASGLAMDIVRSANVFDVGQTNFAVCRYATPEQSDANTYLWINPDPATYGTNNPPAPDLTADAGLNPLLGVGQMVLRQGSAAEGPGAIIVDTVRVEGGWPHVTPIPLTMSIMQTNGTNVFVSWGGYQNVYFQRATNLIAPAWTNLNGGSLLSGNNDGSIRSYTIQNATADTIPKFFRLIAWYPE